MIGGRARNDPGNIGAIGGRSESVVAVSGSNGRDTSTCDLDGGMMVLSTGQNAPDFTLPSHLGTDLRLRDLQGRHVVLTFFPLAWTPV